MAAVTSPMRSQLAAEFIGTYLLVLTVGCNVLSGIPVFAGVSIASVLMVMIYAFGNISGGNFNPAVSVALGITKSLGCPNGKEWRDVLMFCVVQIIAGILAGFTYFALFDQAFNIGPAMGFGIMSAGVCELLYTFILCFVVLNVAATNTENCYYGLAIGFVVVAGAYGAGAVSGGCFNPAVAMGVDVIGGRNLGIGWSFFYTLFELIGAAWAAVFFLLVRPELFGRAEKLGRYSKFVSEFLGTYVLVLTVGLNVLGSSKAGGFSIAASLMCMIYALGDVSGAHFNPAVTLAIFLCPKVEKLPPTQLAYYMIAQVDGAIAAGFTYACIYWRTFPLGSPSGFPWPHVAVAEIVFTFVLCFVVLCVAGSNATKDPHMFGLAIGSCITVGGFAIGSISGGSLNPAVSIGIASTHIWSPKVGYLSIVGNQLGRALLYTLFEFMGACLAVGAVLVTHVTQNSAHDKGLQKPIPLQSQLTAEFIGTFLLVFTVGCNVLSETPVWAGVSIASVLMVMIYALGAVSGANFNPAVSLTQGILNFQNKSWGMPWRSVALYSVVQIVAGILAGICYDSVFGHAFNLGPALGFHWAAAGCCELLYTFMLTFVVLNVTAETNSYYGLAIGFVVIAGAYGAGAVSGGCFNPAVAIGIDVIGGRNLGVGWSMVYLVFEIMGAILASFFFAVVRPRPKVGANLQPITLYSKLVSEFLGTYMLVFTVGLNVLATSPAAAFSIAASLMCMIYALGDISGAHFNPAVTLAILLSETNPRSKMREYGLFVAVQLLAGILAGLSYMAIYNGQGFALGPGKGFRWGDASAAEMIFTFVLCLVVLCVVSKNEPKPGFGQFFGLAIGSCITVGGFAVGKVSGASLNPAVSFGIAISQGIGGLLAAAIYSVSEILGAALAVGAMRAVKPILVFVEKDKSVHGV